MDLYFDYILDMWQMTTLNDLKFLLLGVLVIAWFITRYQD